MADSKVYFTLLVFIKEGEAETFHRYEDLVLPLLSRYNGELLYRVRPQANNFLFPTSNHPYEIHLLTFASMEDFENYRLDKDRLSYSPMFRKAVDKVLLISGTSL